MKAGSMPRGKKLYEWGHKSHVVITLTEWMFTCRYG